MLRNRMQWLLILSLLGSTFVLRAQKIDYEFRLELIDHIRKYQPKHYPMLADSVCEKYAWRIYHHFDSTREVLTVDDRMIVNFYSMDSKEKLYEGLKNFEYLPQEHRCLCITPIKLLLEIYEVYEDEFTGEEYEEFSHDEIHYTVSLIYFKQKLKR